MSHLISLLQRGAFYELRAMLLAAEAVTCSALFREESRGAHFRDDFPETLERWAKNVHTRIEDGRVRSSLAP